jgi:hypothetical protein
MPEVAQMPRPIDRMEAAHLQRRRISDVMQARRSDEQLPLGLVQ